MKWLRLFLVFGVMALAACASNDEQKTALICPQIAVVKDLAKFRDYGRASDPAPRDLVGQAVMAKRAEQCTVEDDEVVAEVTLQILAKRGPSLGEGGFSTPYFIAVLDEHDRIVSKETMSNTFQFVKGDILEFNDLLRITIPRNAKSDVQHNRVWIGFQLSLEQMEQNKKVSMNDAEETDE